MNLFLPDILTEPFILRALVAALVLAVTGGILGSFIQMRGMSFYADTVAHSAFTGVAIGVLLGLNVSWSAVLFGIAVGFAVLWVRERSRLSFDTILGVIFASAAALGIFLLTFLEGVRVDLFGLLFGDILALSWNDVALIAVAGAVALGSIWSIQQQLVLEIVHPDLARVEGVPIRRNNLLFAVVVATMIALGIKLIGVILLSGLFLIPSATSYLVARSLRELVTGSIIFGCMSAIAGVVLSALLNTPTGPTIVLIASGLFMLALLLRPALRHA